MARKYEVISADGHLEAVADLGKYLPEKFQPRAPRFVEIVGGHGWVCEGRPVYSNGLAISGGRPIRPGVASYFNPDGTPAPGTGGPVQRLREQDEDGIDAEVLFPAHQYTKLLDGIDGTDCYLAMVQAYNSWLAKDYCSVAPDRLIGVGVTPASGIDAATTELKRCKELGLKAMAFHQFPNGSGGPNREDERFWEMAGELGIALCAHGTFGASAPPMVPPPGFAVHFGGGRTVYPIAQMLMLRVFDRLPALKIYLSETNASWMPEGWFKFDDGYDRYKGGFDVEFARRPAEYARRNWMFSFVDDKMAIRLREHNPLSENLMWGSAFPRDFSPYPGSRAFLDSVFEDAPAAHRRKVLVENPCQFFGLDPNKALTETP